MDNKTPLIVSNFLPLTKGCIQLSHRHHHHNYSGRNVYCTFSRVSLCSTHYSLLRISASHSSILFLNVCLFRCGYYRLWSTRFIYCGAKSYSKPFQLRGFLYSWVFSSSLGRFRRGFQYHQFYHKIDYYPGSYVCDWKISRPSHIHVWKWDWRWP